MLVMNEVAKSWQIHGELPAMSLDHGLSGLNVLTCF